MTGNDEQIVVDVIDGLVNSKAMFTAFDITKLVRVRLNDLVKQGLSTGECYHSDVRRIVRNYDFPVAYGKTPIAIPGININPLLYHETGANINDYAPLKNAPNTGSFTKPVAPAVPSPVPFRAPSAQVSNTLPFPLSFNDPNSVSGNNVVIPSLDNRGRYCVRSRDITAAGLVPGQEVSMVVKNGEIELVGIPVQGDSILTVDAYSNLRIFQTYFDKAFGHVPSKIVIISDSSKKSVKIREA